MRTTGHRLLVGAAVLGFLVVLTSSKRSSLMEQHRKLGSQTRTFVFQYDFAPNSKSFAKLEGGLSVSLVAFTMCYRIKPYYYRPEVVVVSFADRSTDIFRSDHNRRGMNLFLQSQRVRIATNVSTPLMVWSSWCFAFSTKMGTYDVFMNGQRITNGSWIPMRKVLLSSEEVAVLGQDQDVEGGGFDSTQSFSGELTAFNIWGRFLSEYEMTSVSSCGSLINGDIVSWNDSRWTLTGDVREETRLVHDTCEILPSPYFMFRDRLQFSYAVALCQAFGGTMAVPTSAEEQQELYEMASTISHICAPDGGAIMWLGITDAESEGEWQTVDARNPSNLTYENWDDNQPNGGRIENCAVMKGTVSHGAWTDNSCRKSFKYCPVCRLVVPNYLRFRGICDSNLYDDRLILTGVKNNKPYFRGYYRSQVYYSSAGEWRLENILLPDTFAVMEESGSIDFPIGRHMWIFSHGFCGKPPGTAISLALTQCESDEFTCNNGNCIPLHEVCDRRAQCTDKSDELNCTLVLRPEGYQPSLPPEAPLSEGPLPVILNITIDSFKEIDAINSRFIVELQIRMIWKDVRLHYLNLKSDRQLNLVLEEAAREMWVPAVDFLNAENNAKSRVDSNSKITIMRTGAKEPDNVEMSREAMIYDGKYSFIRISRKYTATFACTFNFFYYPFNTDFCKMIFRVNRNNKPYVKLIRYGPGVTYDHKDKLNEFFIGRMRMVTYNSQAPYSGQQIIVEMQHLYGSQILTMFVPTTIISLIGYGTFFFKWYDFTNRIMVSLTVLLVLTQLFSQTTDMLPKTSYFKLIDIWFFGSITYTFVVIVVHTAVEYMHVYDHEIEDLHEKLQRAANFYREITPTPTPGISDAVRRFSDSDEPQSVPETLAIARDDEGIEGTRRRRRRRRRRRHHRHGHKKREKKFSRNYLLPVVMKARLLWKAMQRPEAKGDRNPNFWPIVVDKLGNIVTTLVYILLNLIFWTVAFAQHVHEPLMDLDDPSYVDSVENATNRVWPVD